MLDRPEQALSHNPIPIRLQLQRYSAHIILHIMAHWQQPDLGHKLPAKFESLILYSLDHSTLYGASVLSHPGAQSEKGSTVSFDSAPRKHSQGDCPDGGLQAWLVVLGVRLPVY